MFGSNRVPKGSVSSDKMFLNILMIVASTSSVLQLFLHYFFSNQTEFCIISASGAKLNVAIIFCIIVIYLLPDWRVQLGH